MMSLESGAKLYLRCGEVNGQLEDTVLLARPDRPA
jgi:hypothetical protein